MGFSCDDLQVILVDHTIRTSGYDEHRDYIGLSSIIDCPAEIYRRFFNPTPASVRQRLKTKASYEIEENLKARLGALGNIYSPGKEIILHGGLVRGHTDGEIRGDLLEIKTVPLDEHLPAGKIPIRVSWQIQAYMKFCPYNLCHLLYYSRENGVFRFFDIHPNLSTMNLIEDKLKRIVAAVQAQVRPACECGKCGEPK